MLLGAVTLRPGRAGAPGLRPGGPGELRADIPAGEVPMDCDALSGVLGVGGSPNRRDAFGLLIPNPPSG